MTRHLYAFVDETGQDTGGELFIVSVVVAVEDVEPLLALCERAEAETGKRAKWRKASYAQRVDYLRRVLFDPLLVGRLYAVASGPGRDYPEMTLRAVARVLAFAGGEDYRAAVRIDGLVRGREQEATTRLRRLGVAGGKVRGVRKDENDALIRLADSVCGLVRDAREGHPEMKALLGRAVRLGVLCEV